MLFEPKTHKVTLVGSGDLDDVLLVLQPDIELNLYLWSGIAQTIQADILRMDHFGLQMMAARDQAFAVTVAQYFAHLYRVIVEPMGDHEKMMDRVKIGTESIMATASLSASEYRDRGPVGQVIGHNIDSIGKMMLVIRAFSTMSELGADGLPIYPNLAIHPATQVFWIMAEFTKFYGWVFEFMSQPYLSQEFSSPVGSPENPPIQHYTFLAT